jgi:ATP-dependent DNA ligase
LAEVEVFARECLLSRAGGEDLRPDPLERRNAGLAKLLRRSQADIQLTERVGHVVFSHACLLGLEGIV